MDDNANDIANDYEAQSIRNYIRVVTDARDRHIADAKRQTDATAWDVAESRMRLVAAEEEVRRAKREHEEANEAHMRAKKFLAMAERPLSDDPLIRRQLGLIHPIRRFPPELLSRIFETTVEATYRAAHLLAFGGKEFHPIQKAPYKVALVCRRWRDVAMQTPAMWRYIFIDLCEVTPAQQPLYEMYMTTAFQRAAKRGIKLLVKSIALTYPPPPDIASRMTWLVPFIRTMTQADGLAALDLSSNNCSGDEIFSGSVLCGSLRNIKLFGQTDLVRFLPTYAPNLVKVHIPLGNFRRRLPRPHPSVDVVEIPHAVAGHQIQGEPHPYESVLEHFPNAREISIDTMAGHGTALHLRHDRLQVLRVDSYKEIDRLAERYTFPQLLKVEIGLSAFQTTDVVRQDAYYHLVSEGCANVRTLGLHHRIEVGRDLALALRGAPLLESLVVPRGCADEEFFAELSSVNDDYGWICPRLSTLRLGRIKTDDIANSLVSLVALRKAAHGGGESVAELARVDAECSEEVSDLIALRVRRL